MLFRSSLQVIMPPGLFLKCKWDPAARGRKASLLHKHLCSKVQAVPVSEQFPSLSSRATLTSGPLCSSQPKGPLTLHCLPCCPVFGPRPPEVLAHESTVWHPILFWESISRLLGATFSTAPITWVLRVIGVEVCPFQAEDLNAC